MKILSQDHQKEYVHSKTILAALSKQFREDLMSSDHQQQQPQPRSPPIPVMPSSLFCQMAQSQLELLANSLSKSREQSTTTTNTSTLNPAARTESKVESMILYLPAENALTGQLEFTPAVLYPDPNTERVFIASDAASGQAPTLPKTLTKLPGFSHASTLLPGYPMLSSLHSQQNKNTPEVGVVEEVLCDIRFKTSALSVPLLHGPQTVGVLLVSPAAIKTSTSTCNSCSTNSSTEVNSHSTQWTDQDKEQVSRAAQSLSVALMMDNERSILKERNLAFRDRLSDSLHQVKNPIMALRTYGKILQTQIAKTKQQRNVVEEDGGDEDVDDGNIHDDIMVSFTTTPQLLELAERLMAQSERVVDLLLPMDRLVEAMEESNNYTPASRVMLPPAHHNDTSQSMVLWQETVINNNNRHSQERHISNSHTDDVVNGTSPYYNIDASQQYTVNVTNPPTDTTHQKCKQTSIDHNINNNNNNNVDSMVHSTMVGDIETEMTFVTDVLEPVLEAFGAIANEHGIQFAVVLPHVDDLPGVMASPKSLQEAVSNVLDNAFKYSTLGKRGDGPLLSSTNPNPRVRVSIFPNDAADESPGVSIIVEDNGPGIDEQDKTFIFQRGYRGLTTAEMVDGRGIGLDIAKALMVRMGGKLEISESSREGDYHFTSLSDDDRLDGTAMKFTLYRKPRHT